MGRIELKEENKKLKKQLLDEANKWADDYNNLADGNKILKEELKSWRKATEVLRRGSNKEWKEWLKQKGEIDGLKRQLAQKDKEIHEHKAHLSKKDKLIRTLALDWAYEVYKDGLSATEIEKAARDRIKTIQRMKKH